MFNQDIDVSSGYTPCPKCSLPFCSSSCLKTRCQHSAAECQIFSRSDPPVTRADLDTGVVLASLTPLRLLRLRSGDAPLYSRVNMLVDNIQEIRWSQANTDHHELNAQLLKLCTNTELWNGMKTKMNFDVPGRLQTMKHKRRLSSFCRRDARWQNIHQMMFTELWVSSRATVAACQVLSVFSPSLLI